MSLNPLNELKRRLQDESTPLPKRLCLATNVVQSHHFPTAPKERVIAEWLELLVEKNVISSQDLRSVIGWLNFVDDLTSELKGKLIQVVSQYLQKNTLRDEDTQGIISLLENSKITSQLVLHINDYLLITTKLLQYLRNDQLSTNVTLIQRIFHNLTNYNRECKRKLEFVVKFLDGEHLETIFSYLDTECRLTVIEVCQNIIFSMNKKSFFVSFLQTLIRKDNIDELMAEKGENIQSVLKIMSAFFTFPKGRTVKSQKFLADFIDVFVSCFKRESQLVFAFYIMVVNSLNMNQSYLSPAMKMPPIMFDQNDEKIKRNLFLGMLEVLLRNDVDVSVRLTDTFGEKISKVEIKKNFTSFLQAVLMGQLKLEGKVDKSTLQIIKITLKLDPMLIEQKMEQILPPIMTAKKNNANIMESYTEMLNCLLEILFKLSRGTVFVNQILPHVKLCLEANNTEQFELKQEIKESIENGSDCEKLKAKIITGNDIFPSECVDLYGKWTSELMFRQNKELLVSLQKEMEEYCLMMLDEGFVSPSIITLAEVLSAILSSFLRHNKMADHTVPRQVAEDFWATFQKFEMECLKKFGECVLKLSYIPPLALAYLKLCLSFCYLKLLNLKYSNTKLDAPQVADTSEVMDLSVLLPCLSSQQWIALTAKIVEFDAVLVLDNLLLAKTTAIKLVSHHTAVHDQAILSTKTSIIKQLTSNTDIVTDSYSAKVLFADLEKGQLKQSAKSLVKLHLSNPDSDILKGDSVLNRPLLNAIVVETVRNVTKCFENNDLSKWLSKSDFDLAAFTKGIDTKKYFEDISLKDGQESTVLNCIEVFKQIPVHSLEEQFLLLTVFILLLTKKCCHTKKVRKSIDYVLQSVYELSPKYPDLYKIYTVEFIFAFEDTMLIDLLTLKIKTPNNLLIIKCILETAVKKVKTDSEIVKNLVELLLKKQRNKKDDITSKEFFSDAAFQISCLILPIIAKEKKAITTSAYRSILANLQEKLHKSMLDSFKNIDFSNSSVTSADSGNINDSAVVSESNLATLNAMGAYSLTLSKYCETTDVEEIKNLDCLWSALDFFVKQSIQAIKNPSSKNQHIESSMQLLNVTLRHTKKLESHEMFQNKDELFIQMWRSIIARLLLVFEQGDLKRNCWVEDVSVACKFLCELASVECFLLNFVVELAKLGALKNPSEIAKNGTPSQLTSHKVSKYLWTQCLKANIVGPKCVALSKLMFKASRESRFWVQQYIEFNRNTQDGVAIKSEEIYKNNNTVDEFENYESEENGLNVIKIDDEVCELLKIDLDTLSEVVLAAKKISLDYKFMDSIFELQHLVHLILGCNTMSIRCEVSWQAFFKLFESCIALLNSLLVSREELLEDRWPCFMQCYRALTARLCARSSSHAHVDRALEERLAETAHSVEKLTQSVCKRRTHISRIAAYTVADICSLLELAAPSKMVRQHLENAVAALIQASDSSYAMAFLRRALAGAPGQTTMTNLYTMYKRYHKYTGNA